MERSCLVVGRGRGGLHKNDSRSGHRTRVSSASAGTSTILAAVATVAAVMAFMSCWFPLRAGGIWRSDCLYFGSRPALGCATGHASLGAFTGSCGCVARIQQHGVRPISPEMLEPIHQTLTIRREGEPLLSDWRSRDVPAQPLESSTIRTPGPLISGATTSDRRSQLCGRFPKSKRMIEDESRKSAHARF